MSLYALGDLHLSFQSDKSMDIFGSVWKRHERKIEKYVNRIVKPDDTLVLTGDHSWGRKLPECREDLAFIERLPGHKILLRGNHDMFWDAKKTERLNEEYKDRLFFLQNNFAVYEDYALVGTKGFTFEGPFYLDRWGNITGWDEKKEEQAEKLAAREMDKTERLNEEYKDRLFFLQNNFAVYEDYALVGTKGFTFEGPFYLDRWGNITGWDEKKEEQAEKLAAREMDRLRESFRQAADAGYRKFIMFLHYPPTNILEETSPFTEIAEEYGVSAVVYSHCHGESRFGDSILGEFHGIRYMLVSGDFLNFRPALVLP